MSLQQRYNTKAAALYRDKVRQIIHAVVSLNFTSLYLRLSCKVFIVISLFVSIFSHLMSSHLTSVFIKANFLFWLICLQIATLAQGHEWNEATSSAQNYDSSSMNRYNSSSGMGSNSYGNDNGLYQSNSDSGSYQSGGGYQSLDAQQNFRDQKEAFFSRKQNENALKPE